jgi:hypothetical protein
MLVMLSNLNIHGLIYGDGGKHRGNRDRALANIQVDEIDLQAIQKHGESISFDI